MIHASSPTEKRDAETAEDSRPPARQGPTSGATPADPATSAEGRGSRPSDELSEGVELKDRLAELERRSLLAEQARQLAHRMRTPLNVIELICENLQIELQQDEEQLARLDSALDAVSRLATILNETVKSNRFAPGPPRPVDAARMTARVVRLHGGSVEGYEAVRRWPRVVLEPRAFEAAIMHCLRLIGLGPGREAPGLSLKAELVDDSLRLELRGRGPAGGDGAPLTSHPTLLAQAAERAIRESGGTLSLAEGAATMHLPIAKR